MTTQSMHGPARRKRMHDRAGVTSAAPGDRSYLIGPFLLDPAARFLSQHGVATPLGARAVDVLHALVARANEPVSKAQLIDAAWPGLVVEEGNLAVQISAIRRVLAQLPGAQGWIETIARRGYRFVGPVTQLAAHSGAERGGARLPLPVTKFIGRERELTEIKRLLPTTRLLTLVGPGGVGKTRLAVQVATELDDAYPDGVFMVELGALVDAALVSAAVAESLGIAERADRPLTQTLAAHLRSRNLLLVLDNCEHLLEACQALVRDILMRTSEPTFIATSREPLRVHGERVLQVPALALADSDASAQEIANADAVQLFIDRVRRSQAGFALAGERAQVVADICRRLDGIPLALELAAARARTLSVEQIQARLHERFRLLTSLSAVPSRQQTMRTTLDWSYDLLSEAERVVLRRLSIFPGSFTLEAAAAVASDDMVDAHAIVDILSQLVARSLVVPETNADATRYRLLETTRSYATEKLAETGEDAPLRRAHAMHFREHFMSAPHDWMRMPDAAWRARYALELDNVRAALDWALSSDGDAALAIALAGHSGAVWSTRSLLGEGARRLRAATECIAVVRPGAADEARLWLSLAVLIESSPALALESLQRAERLYAVVDDRVALVDTRRRQARALAQTGRHDDAARVLAETFPLAQRCGLPKLLGFHFNDRAFLKSLIGDLAGARDDYSRSLELCTRAGAQFAISATTANLAEIKWSLGDFEGARVAFDAHVATLRKSSAPRMSSLGFALFNLAGVQIEQSDLDCALINAREAFRLLTPTTAWIFADHLAVRAALAGDIERGARLAGFSDAAYAANCATRQPNEARARARLLGFLEHRLALGMRDRLRSEGGALSADAAWRLALER